MVSFAQVDTWIRKCCLSRALGTEGEVGHVTSVRALGVLQAMVFLVGIEMWTRRREPGPFALSHLVDVCGMLSGRKVLHVQLDRPAGPAFSAGECGSTDTLPLSIFELHGYRFARGVYY